MPIIIENVFKDIKRIRIKYELGSFTVIWPNSLDITYNDREFKIHSAIKRSYAHNGLFTNFNFLTSNVQINRLDKFDSIDLYWEEPKGVCMS